MALPSEPLSSHADEWMGEVIRELADDETLPADLRALKELWQAGKLEHERLPDELIMLARERSRQRSAS